MSRLNVVDTLVARDGVSREEARARVQDTRAQIYDALENEEYDAVEDIVYGELGLEMDYIEDILF